MGVHGDSGWSFSFENNPLWKLKLRLQHTGWLQYALPFFWAFFSLMLATIEYIAFGSSRVGLTLALIFLGLGTFDIATCKYNLRPLESIPPSQDHWTRIETMLKRHSCRSFQTRKLTQAHKSEILDVAQVCLHKKIFAKDIRLEFIDTPIKVWPAVNCQEFLVAIAPAQYSKQAIWDLGKSLEHTVLHATRMGLGTLWVGPGADHESIVQALGDKRFDPQRDHIICVCALGYPSAFAPTMIRLMSKVTSTKRLALEKLVMGGPQCQQPLEDAAIYEKLKPAFEAVRWSPSSYNAQTTRCSASVTDKGFLEKVDFYRSLPSKYYATVALGVWMAHWEEACKELGFEGKFEIDKTRIAEDEGMFPPIYDISWVFDKPIQIERETHVAKRSY